MINAAEPIDSSVVITFNETFGIYGLPPQVMKPTYGLAEHTVFVCSDGQQILKIVKSALEKGFVEILTESTISELTLHHEIVTKEATDSQDIIGCGYPSKNPDVEVLIVNHETFHICPKNMVGEVWIRSPSKAQGYWGLEELTKEDFHAEYTLPIKSTEISNAEEIIENNEILNPETKNIHEIVSINTQGFLRTGDLGFLYKNELFICGRLKDLIIIRGTNHYPQDIERTAEKVTDFIRLGCSAAFSIKRIGDSTESVIYVAEVRIMNFNSVKLLFVIILCFLVKRKC